ncbi:hypothetical protein B0J14DRAFT_588119 [Halenospora varia]|nr:hypothetical protein B0J14DRAFT_588119 [Halenospora varia]
MEPLPLAHNSTLLAHFQTCPLHRDEKDEICSARLKDGRKCTHKAMQFRQSGMMPTCNPHHRQAKYATYCRTSMLCGSECGRLCELQIHGFQSCEVHRTAPRECYFLKIPLEIRFQIYGYLFSEDAVPARFEFVSVCPQYVVPRRMAILRTNRQIHEEATRQFYGSTNFTVEVYLSGLMMCDIPEGSRKYDPRCAETMMAVQPYTGDMGLRNQLAQRRHLQTMQRQHAVQVARSQALQASSGVSNHLSPMISGSNHQQVLRQTHQQATQMGIHLNIPQLQVAGQQQMQSTVQQCSQPQPQQVSMQQQQQAILQQAAFQQAAAAQLARNQAFANSPMRMQQVMLQQQRQQMSSNVARNLKRDCTEPSQPPATPKNFNMINSFTIEIILPFSANIAPIHSNAMYGIPMGIMPRNIQSAGVDDRLYDYCDHLHKIVRRLRLSHKPISKLEVAIRCGRSYIGRQSWRKDLVDSIELMLQPFKYLTVKNVNIREITFVCANDPLHNENSLFTELEDKDPTQKTRLNTLLAGWKQSLTSSSPPPAYPLIFSGYLQVEQLVNGIMKNQLHTYSKFSDFPDLLHAAKVAREADNMAGLRAVWQRIVNIWIEYLGEQDRSRTKMARAISGGYAALKCGGDNGDADEDGVTRTIGGREKELIIPD